MTEDAYRRDEAYRHVSAAVRDPTGAGAAAYAELLATLDRARATLANAPLVEEENTEADLELKVVLDSVGSNVSLLTRESHYNLIERLFDGVTMGRGLSPWFLEQNSRRSLLDLLTNLVVSGSLANTALDFLVRSFCPPLGLRQWSGTAATEVRRRRQGAILADLKTTVQACLRMAPTLYEEVVQQVLSKWPHKYMDLLRSESYFRIAFWLARGPARHAADRIVSCAVNALVELDVETKWEGVGDLAQLEDFPTPEKAQKRDVGDFEELDEADMFEYGTVQEVAGSSLARSGQKKAAETVVDADSNLEKLDALVQIGLEYLKEVHDEGSGAAVHEALMGCFQRSIFPVHNTRLTQFLVFYSWSRQQSCKKMIVFLSGVFRAAGHPDEARARAVMYLGSFVAHAESLPFALSCEVMSVIADWCAQFCQHSVKGDAGTAVAEPSGFATFFYAFQALLYSFTYVSSSAREVVQWSFLSKLCNSCLVQICYHWSNPLAKCSTSVVEDFLQQVTRLKLIDRETVSKLRQLHGDATVESDQHFPFRCGNLKLCGPFIVLHGAYRSQPMKPVGSHDHLFADIDHHFKVGSMGQRSDTHFSQSPSNGFPGSYLSEEDDFMQYNGASTAREAWFAGNQRPIPIGMKAQELFAGFGASPGGHGGSLFSGSMSTSPDMSMSLSASLNENKGFVKHFASYKK
ncbi:RNA polymerase I-specific transcription initiation factor [Chloropicon primus]|uniref:RNA polymerase I-specific transcription initiation factor n=1 Tax=Chloropicon primus TaxID=1764295 RepID=A0A5B8MIG6_9CHLO|nr:RNA polymerase I-specific transcription initiation factor [Chloropicon primus]UPQ99390.1 RNA polymerase I-specific transcription initiation factor [Chloropicon primus]|eukprot:QDZ20179.1 RNA polymerase I-specific transcription initiation factor [Chloropicon primus]